MQSAPSGRVRRAPHSAAGCGEPGTNLGHEVLGACRTSRHLRARRGTVSAAGGRGGRGRRVAEGARAGRRAAWGTGGRGRHGHRSGDAHIARCWRQRPRLRALGGDGRGRATLARTAFRCGGRRRPGSRATGERRRSRPGGLVPRSFLRMVWRRLAGANRGRAPEDVGRARPRRHARPDRDPRNR